MKCTKFEDLQVTTSVVHIWLSENIDLQTLLWFLELTPYTVGSEDLKKQILNTKKKDIKYKLPLMKPGDILTMRFNGEKFCRGSSKKFHSFKNSLTLDMSIGVKNVNLKIYKNNIQVSGVKNPDQAKEACEYLIQKILHLKNKLQMEGGDLKYMASCIREKIKSLSWPCPKLDIPGVGFDFHESCLNSIINNWTMIETVDNILCFCDTLEKVNLKDLTICSNTLKQIDTLQLMVLYNVDIGRKIDKSRLRDILKQYPEYNVIYHNDIGRLKIQIPYIKTHTKTKSKKPPKHTVQFNETGKLVLSGPNELLLKGVYEKLITIMKASEDLF